MANNVHIGFLNITLESSQRLNYQKWIQIVSFQPFDISKRCEIDLLFLSLVILFLTLLLFNMLQKFMLIIFVVSIVSNFC
jgi:hypothetical protein